MRLVDALVRDFPWRIWHDPYLLHPGGESVNAGPVLDWIIAAAALVLGAGAPSPRLVDVVGAYVPPVLGALTVVPVYVLGRELFSRNAGLWAGFMVAVMPGQLLQRSVLGFTDHHCAEVLLSTTALMFVVLALKRPPECFLVSHSRPGRWPGTRRVSPDLGRRCSVRRDSRGVGRASVTRRCRARRRDRRCRARRPSGAADCGDDGLALGRNTPAFRLPAWLTRRRRDGHLGPALQPPNGAASRVERRGVGGRRRRGGLRVSRACIGRDGRQRGEPCLGCTSGLALQATGIRRRGAAADGLGAVAPRSRSGRSSRAAWCWPSSGAGCCSAGQDWAASPRIALLGCWTATTIFATFGQVRFAYYLAVNVALIGGFACDRAIGAVGVIRASRSDPGPGHVLDGLPGDLPGVPILRPIRNASAALNANWYDALMWLGANTPEPFSNRARVLPPRPRRFRGGGLRCSRAVGLRLLDYPGCATRAGHEPSADRCAGGRGVPAVIE